MRSDNGFTLLEALFAMAIFAVAMLGVIGLQINAFQTDEETRRKDLAVQLLNEGAELVECRDYDAFGGVRDIDYEGLIAGARANENAYFWMGTNNDKAKLYCGQRQVNTGDVTFRRVYLVAAWESVKTDRREALGRIMVKTQNMLQ